MTSVAVIEHAGMASVTMKEQAEMISMAMTLQAKKAENSGMAYVAVTGDPAAQSQHSWP